MTERQPQSNGAPPIRASLDTLLDQLPQAAMLADSTGMVRYVNQAAQKLWPGGFPLGSNLYDHPARPYVTTPAGTLFTPSDWPFTRSITAGETCRDVEIVVRMPGQPPQHVALSTTPVREADQITGALITLQPLHTLRLLQDSLAARNRSLEALNDLAARLLQLDSSTAVYEAALDGVLGIVGAQHGGIMIADDAAQQFRAGPYRGYDARTAAGGNYLAYSVPSLISHARESGELVVEHNDAASAIQLMSSIGLQTVVVLPLCQGNHCLGTLSYGLSEYHDPAADEREFLRTAATYVAAALERARLYEEAAAERARLAHVLDQIPVGVFIAEGNAAAHTMHWNYINPVGQQQIAAATITPGAISETATVVRPDGSPYKDEDLPIQRHLWTGLPAQEQEFVVRFHSGAERIFSATTNLLREDGDTREVVQVLQDITKRKQLEAEVQHQAAAVQAEYERLATLVAHVDISMNMMDAQGRFLWANDTWFRNSGYTPEQVIGRRYDEFGIHSDTASIQTLIDEVLATGIPFQQREFYIENPRQPGGVYIDGSVQALRDSAGRVTGVLSAIIDVSERVRARQALEQQTALLTAIFENAAVGIIVYDRDLRILNLNSAHARMARMDPAAVRGQHLFTVAPTARARQVLFDQVLAGQAMDINGMAFQFPDGDQCYYDVRYRPLRDASGAVIGILSTSVDVTEATRTRQEIDNQRVLQQTILEGVPVGIAYYDRALRLLNCNAAWSAMTSVDLAQAVGRVVYEIVPSTRAYQELHTRVLAGEEAEVRGRAVPLRGQEGMRYYDIFYRPVRNAGGAIIGLLSASIDVTMRMELDQQKDEFIALASHELKTPITAIKGYAQSGLRSASKLGDERLTRTMGIIDEQSNRLTRLINDLLDVSRMESSTLELYQEPFDLRSLVDEVVANLQLTAPQFTLALTMPDKPVVIQADRQRLDQVLINLVQNAIKYSDSSERVEISMALAEGEVITAVHDYGVGIPADQLGRVFNRFFRASNVSARRYSGLGLGLFIAYGIVLRHGGRMWVESVEGAGSTFAFALPLAPPDGAGGATKGSPAA